MIVRRPVQHPDEATLIELVSCGLEVHHRVGKKAIRTNGKRLTRVVKPTVVFAKPSTRGPGLSRFGGGEVPTIRLARSSPVVASNRRRTESGRSNKQIAAIQSSGGAIGERKAAEPGLQAGIISERKRDVSRFQQHGGIGRLTPEQCGDDSGRRIEAASDSFNADARELHPWINASRLSRLLAEGPECGAQVRGEIVGKRDVTQLEKSCDGQRIGMNRVGGRRRLRRRRPTAPSPRAKNAAQHAVR